MFGTQAIRAQRHPSGCGCHGTSSALISFSMGILPEIARHSKTQTPSEKALEWMPWFS